MNEVIESFRSQTQNSWGKSLEAELIYIIQAYYINAN